MIVLDKKNTRLFFEYIKNRHEIYKKRLSQVPPPWTSDPILQSYKFTNVFRDLDPGTTFVISNIIAKSDDLSEILFNIIIYRLFNKIPSYKAIGFQCLQSYSREDIERPLREILQNGGSIFTNAFLVSPYAFVSHEPDKLARVCWIIDEIFWQIQTTAEEIHSNQLSSVTYKILKRLPGIGIFLAYQIAVDLGYLNPAYYDESTHVIAGPGCRRGINRIFRSKGNLNYEDAIQYLVDIQEIWFSKLEVNSNDLFSDRESRKLNLMAMENCLCEISKYLKVYYGEGRPRNKFNY